MNKPKKEIIKRLEKVCVCCGKKINVILYKDKSYRNGHYFGKILNDDKKEYWNVPNVIGVSKEFINKN